MFSFEVFLHVPMDRSDLEKIIGISANTDIQKSVEKSLALGLMQNQKNISESDFYGMFTFVMFMTLSEAANRNPSKELMFRGILFSLYNEWIHFQ